MGGIDVETQDEQELVRQAMSVIGRARTEKKIAAARATAEARKGKPLSEEHKAKLKESQRLRREREKEERAALGLDAPQEKKPRGRPKKTETAIHTPERAEASQNGKQGQE
jgi:hypothetical protein